MIITAEFHNHCIELPPDFAVRGGGEVCVTLPEDLVAEHDHYNHGTPKRSR